MPTEVVRSLPEWLVVGTGLSLASVVVVTCVFVVGTRLFPSSMSDTRRFSGEGKRRREIRKFLRTIDEPFAENHPIHGQPVAFYLPTRNVAITFDARAYYRIQRTQTYAVLVEHEMPGVHLGSRLPFETPDFVVAGDPTSAAFAALGLPVEASKNEVKTAYRKQVKQAHPDHGGNHEEFRRVREAYTTAKEHAN